MTARGHTLALLQAAFSAALASCAPPAPAVIAAEPSPPPEAPAETAVVVAPAPSAPASTPAPASTDGDPAVPTPPGGPAADRRFVDGDANMRHLGQLCLGRLVPSLRPGKPVDSLEMRLLRRKNREIEVVVTGRAGSPCGTAKDRDTCQRAFDAAQPTIAGEVLVFTRGDEVGIVAPADIPAFLAPIDSPEEAAAVLVYTPPDEQADVSCDPATFKATKTGFTSTQERWSRCDHDIFTYTVGKDGKARRAGTRHIVGQRPCRMPVPGRKPAGLASTTPPEDEGSSSLGAYLAEACTLEAASVTSFRRLDHELGSLDAPPALRRRAKASAIDEGRHARIMRRLARRAGAEPQRPKIAPITPRTPVEIALENAVEGCVHETWAALVARFQADHATDAELRAAMQTIARDEAQHAALAWDVHAWLETRLSVEERWRVQTAYAHALTKLVRETGHDLEEAAREALGLPTAETTRALVTAWAARAPALGRPPSKAAVSS